MPGLKKSVTPDHLFIREYLQILGIRDWDHATSKDFVLDVSALDVDACIKKFDDTEMMLKLRTVISSGNVLRLKKSADPISSLNDLLMLLRSLARVCGYKVVSAYTLTGVKGKMNQFIRVTTPDGTFFNTGRQDEVGD